MIKITRPIFILSMLTILLASCVRQAPVYNVDSNIQNIEQTQLSSSQVGKIISQAAINKDWVINKSNSESIVCTYSWKNYSATSVIKYSATGYTINLVSSVNLLQQDGKIHHKYNELVEELQKEIDQRIAHATIQ